MKRQYQPSISRLVSLACFVLLRPLGAQAQQASRPVADFVEPDFPFITTTLDARHLGPAFPERNFTIRCVAVQLGHEAYACFDTDLLRMALGWRGAFMSMETMAQVSYREPGTKNSDFSRILGQPIIGTGVYPGWLGAGESFADPRPQGPYPDGVGRGPIAAGQGRWEGLYTVGDRVVLAYTVRGVRIYEQPSSVAVAEEVGLVRTFRVDRVTEPLTLVVGEVRDGVAATVAGAVAQIVEGAARDTLTAVAGLNLPGGATLHVTDRRYLTLRLPAGTPASQFSLLIWRGAASAVDVFQQMQGTPAPMVDFAQGGPARWPEVVTTRGRVAPETSAFVVDELTLPLPNPWRRDVRVAGVDFFEDGRAALVTFDGDVWLVSGIDAALQMLRWKRFASGLYEPLTVKVVAGEVFVHGRAQITRLRDLNGDDEADSYENFSNLYVQSGETREYPLDMAARPGGGFYLAQGGALDNGPRTTPSSLPGFRLGAMHSGTILEVAPDGRSLRVFASGFREPFLGVHPRTGVVTASDQQGNFVPSTPVYVVREGQFYGVLPTVHEADSSSAVAPITWIPHQVDPSGAGQVWITSDRMGPLNGALVHFSYGKPGVFRVYIDSTGQASQGGIVAVPARFPAPVLKGAVHPKDGQLYVTGFKIYDSRAERMSGFMRLRYTGQPHTLPHAVRAGEQGILLQFDTPLDPVSATRPANYQVQRWQYRRTPAYGSGHYKTDGTPGQETLPVASASLSAAGDAVLLVLPDMQAVMQMAVAYTLATETGAAVQDTVYLTVHTPDPLDLASAGFAEVDWQQALTQTVRTATAENEAPPSAERGAVLYRQRSCIACHSIDGTLDGKTGPTFKGLYGTRRTFEDQRARTADEAYLRQSILEPAAEIVDGFPAEMPSFVGVLSEVEVASLILFIKSLGDE